MIKKLFKSIENLIFEEEKTSDKAQAQTLHFFLKRMYKELTQCSNAEADYMATCKLGEFVHYGLVEETLNKFWKQQQKIA